MWNTSTTSSSTASATKTYKGLPSFHSYSITLYPSLHHRPFFFLSSPTQPQTITSTMHLKSLLLSSTLALSTSALPQSASIPNGTPFKLQTFQFQHPVQGATVQAAQRSLFVNLPAQNATCTSGPDPNTATFYIKDQELRLWSCAETVGERRNQTVFVDRSGMGRLFSFSLSSLS